MDDKEIYELVEFQGKELRDIIEHAVIVASKNISESIENFRHDVCNRLEQIEESLDEISLGISER